MKTFFFFRYEHYVNTSYSEYTDRCIPYIEYLSISVDILLERRKRVYMKNIDS